MKKERSTSQVNFKCPAGMLNLIDKDVEETEEFRNRSEWLICAARYFLDHREEVKNKRKEENGDFIISSQTNIQNRIK